ncbi:MAG: iron-containing alcohol dehydrogenase [Succinivibrionaceae bacterium]|nr:iron-containing alcohol dehydrogenase [Succinivibrionaceae bacterium]
MDSFEFCRPTRYIFGQGEERSVGRIVSEYGYRHALVVYGTGSVVRSGLLGRVCAALDEAGVAHDELGGVQPNPRADKVYEGVALGKSRGVDFVLAVGGGSAIDTAKAIALGIPTDTDFFDFYLGLAQPQKALRTGVILTIPAAGSEGSNSSVIQKEVDGAVQKLGLSHDFNVPLFSILNPELTFTLPPYQTACGVVDMLAHVMERYFTNTRDVSITDRTCEAVMLSIIETAPRAIADPSDYGARANLMWAGMLAHNNLCGVGREQDWTTHHLEHQLSALYDVAHGAGLAVLFPCWMERVINHDVMRLAQFAVRVFNVPMDFADPGRTARQGIAALRAFYRSIGMPLSFRDIGARREDIERLLAMLGIDRHPEGHFVVLSREDCEAIYTRAATYGEE